MKSKKIKQIIFFAVSFFTCMADMGYAYAEEVGTGIDIGKKIGNVVLDNVFWLILVAVIVVVCMAAVKRNIVGVVSTILIGGIVLYFVRNPESISNFGSSIAKAIGF